jgi:hypothetical protein
MEEKVLDRELENCGFVLRLCSLNRQLQALCDTRYRGNIQRIIVLSIRCFYLKLTIMLDLWKYMEKSTLTLH